MPEGRRAEGVFEFGDKSTLIAAVWPNVGVEENNLNQVISALRRALGDGRSWERSTQPLTSRTNHSTGSLTPEPSVLHGVSCGCGKCSRSDRTCAFRRCAGA